MFLRIGRTKFFLDSEKGVRGSGFCNRFEVSLDGRVLFAAADRFGVERLRALCSDRIEGMLSAANVCDVLTVADQAKRGRAEAPLLPVPLPRPGRVPPPAP